MKINFINTCNAKLLIILLFFILKISAFCQVTVEVSSNYSAIEKTNSIRLLTEEKEIFDLNLISKTDELKLLYKVGNNPITFWVIDGRDVINNSPNPTFLVNKKLTGTSVLSLPKIPTDSGISITFINENQSAMDLNYAILRQGTRSKAITSEMKNFIGIPIVALAKFYKLPKFKVRVEPCGTVNAFSSPDISICTELIADLIDKGLEKALYPILLHEMAHSLLMLWNLPGYDNEDIADEFSAVILSKAAPDRSIP